MMTNIFEDQRDILGILDPLEQQIGHDSMLVYLALLNSGPKTSVQKLENILNNNDYDVSQKNIYKNITLLQEEGIILTRFNVGGKSKQYYAINPSILIELAFILYSHQSIEYAQIDAEQSSSRTYVNDLKIKAKEIWSDNGFNLGTFNEKDTEIKDILTFKTSLGPLYLFGWLDSLRDKLKNKNLWFFTPSLTFLGSRKDKKYFMTFFTDIFTNLKCNCYFFVKPGSGDYNFSGINKIYSELPKGPIYHWYKIRPSMFPTYYRINVFSDNLGAIFIKLNDRYYGELFDNNSEKINELIQSLDDLRKTSPEKKEYDSILESN